MKNEFDRILEEVVKKGMSVQSLESPGADFTKNVLAKTESRPLLNQPPLISKKMWLVISIFVVSSVLLGLLVEMAVEPMQVLNSLSKIGIPEWSLVQIPNTLIYTICISAVFIWIQVSWLKNYFQSRSVFS